MNYRVYHNDYIDTPEFPGLLSHDVTRCYRSKENISPLISIITSFFFIRSARHRHSFLLVVYYSGNNIPGVPPPPQPTESCRSVSTTIGRCWLFSAFTRLPDEPVDGGTPAKKVKKKTHWGNTSKLIFGAHQNNSFSVVRVFKTFIWRSAAVSHLRRIAKISLSKKEVPKSCCVILYPQQQQQQQQG